MTVRFVGAGPGAPDLLTLRGHRVIASSPVCLYAGSLVPEEVVAAAPPGARVLDSSAMTLPEIVAAMADAHRQGLDVARVHSGDPSLYGAVSEQIRQLERRRIPYEIVPGVPAFAAAAAALGVELTLPGVVQTVVLTRTASRSSPMPEGESLANLAGTGATLAIHLSVRALRRIERELAPVVGADCPVIVAYAVGRPDQLILRGTLSSIREKVRVRKITRTALVLVGRGLAVRHGEDSALYDAARPHLLRPKARAAGALS